MKASTRIIDFIKNEENRAIINLPSTAWIKAYKDPTSTGGFAWAIGYGFRSDEFGDPIRQGQESKMSYIEKTLLPYHIGIAETAVNRYISVPLNQSQFDALVSLTYNIGSGNFQKYFAPVINANPNDYTAISKRFLTWANPNNRRNREIAIYQENQSTGSNTMFWVVGLAVLAAIGISQRKKIASLFKK